MAVLAFAPIGVAPTVASAQGPSPSAELAGGEIAVEAPAATSSGSSAASTARQRYERIRRGVVVIERGGQPQALGTVLDGDGRILTSLSGLGGTDRTEVRFADGTTVHAKIGVSRADVDLALLVPESGRRTEGLQASESAPEDAQLRVLVPSGRGTQLIPVAASVKGRAEAHGRGGEPLSDMVDADVQGAAVVGAPLLDAHGGVVAVLVRVCKGGAALSGGDAGSLGAWPGSGSAVAGSRGPCSPIVVGAPIAVVRSFLTRSAAPPPVRGSSSAPANVAPAAPWLGIRGEPEATGGLRGVRITDVAHASPAESAGLKAQDVIVAVDGKPIDKPDVLGASIAQHAIGDAVKLLVFGGGKFREIAVVLTSAP